MNPAPPATKATGDYTIQATEIGLFSLDYVLFGTYINWVGPWRISFFFLSTKVIAEYDVKIRIS